MPEEAMNSSSEGAETPAAAGDPADVVVESSSESDRDDIVEITLDIGDGAVAEAPRNFRAGGGGGSRRQLSPTAIGRIRQVSAELRRLGRSQRRRRRVVNRSESAADHVLKLLRFISNTGTASRWPAVEKRFDELSHDGELHRSEFGQCIGTDDLGLAEELFDTLAWRRNISGDSISREELLQFCNEMSEQRLETFFDMVDKNDDVRITSEEVKEIITLNASGNRLPDIHEEAEEEARQIMEELDPENLGYVQLCTLKLLLQQMPSYSLRIEKAHSRNLSRQLSRRLHARTAAESADPTPVQRWRRRVKSLSRRRVWAALLWLSACGALFAWKFVQRRRRAAGELCACVDKGAAETVKLNMALVLLPVCRNAITWARGRAVPFDDGVSFHKVVAAGLAAGAGLHVVSQLVCGFPRLRQRRADGWTGLAMVLIMAVAFTLATRRFRRRLTGFEAFWYTHHLLAVVYALLIVHGQFLYLSDHWYNKTTWMYLAAPMSLYACERLARALRSSVWMVVKIVKVAVYPGDVIMLLFSKPEGFRYKSGQYIFINCPTVSAFQWHPFYITSAPQDDHISVHIRASGDWTRELREALETALRPPVTEGSISKLLLADKATGMSIPSPPKVQIDGPYGTSVQDYNQYDVILLIGFGIGATPMISIVKDMVNIIKQLDSDAETGSPANGNSATSSSFRTRRAYFHWVTREQRSFEWFRGAMDEVANSDHTKGIIDVDMYCIDVRNKEGDTRSALRAMLQSLSHAKHGIDNSGTRVRTHFACPKWRSVFKRIAIYHDNQQAGVFYYGPRALRKELHELAQEFSSMTNTKFKFHKVYF